MKRNPDDRRDNVDKIQRNIDSTMQNIRRTEEMLNNTSDDKMRKDLIDKNERREAAIDGLRHEIKDEADWQERKKKS
ncbi:MAG: small acid-soluble spore protein Tlp [Clostridiales bacterium]|nr:small acid-soluble spore protein Tlp [Clostridiales bacterium]